MWEIIMNENMTREDWVEVTHRPETLFGGQPPYVPYYWCQLDPQADAAIVLGFVVRASDVRTFPELRGRAIVFLAAGDDGSVREITPEHYEEC
jgi:hypothetical protein